MKGENNNSTGARSGRKILPLTELAGVLAEVKSTGAVVVHCHGVFDLVHPGHIRHLEEARSQGDVLVVTITPDEFVNKGPGRPLFNAQLRAESLAALASVDYVAINNWPTAVETIQLLRPDIYVKGLEYANKENDITGKISDEENAVRSVGGKIHFTDDITFSSSHLINSQFQVFDERTEKWLRSFRAKYSVSDLEKYLNSIKGLRILVVGEAIIDEYAFCDGLGKSSKDPILAFRYTHMEAHGGGSIAVANHIAGFCDNVALVTMLGDRDRREDLVQESLLPNIQRHFVTRRDSSTIHKRRFVDNHTGTRMFELYMMNDAELDARDEAELQRTLSSLVAEYDVVISVDYGHGMMSASAIDLLCAKARFLAVNTQANAGNRGFNTISKYRRADYVCLAGHEVAIETRLRHADMKDLIQQIGERIDVARMSVTLGKDGMVLWEAGQPMVEVPALATTVRDRVGAGDAVLALTSPLTAVHVPRDVVGFLGNLAGAEMVAVLGNRTSIARTTILKHAGALLK